MVISTARPAPASSASSLPPARRSGGKDRSAARVSASRIGRLYVRQFSNGDVILVEPNPKEYVEKGRVKQPDRSTFAAWPHPIVADGGLFVRDHGTLVCWDIKK